jgi:hypothetical protein
MNHKIIRTKDALNQGSKPNLVKHFVLYICEFLPIRSRDIEYIPWAEKEYLWSGRFPGISLFPVLLRKRYSGKCDDINRKRVRVRKERTPKNISGYRLFKKALWKVSFLTMRFSFDRVAEES